MAQKRTRTHQARSFPIALSVAIGLLGAGRTSKDPKNRKRGWQDRRNRRRSLYDMAMTVQAENFVRYLAVSLPLNFLESSRSNFASPCSAGRKFNLVFSPCRGHCIREKASKLDFANDETDFIRLRKTFQSGRRHHALFAGRKWDFETKRDIRAKCGTSATFQRGLKEVFSLTVAPRATVPTRWPSSCTE